MREVVLSEVNHLIEDTNELTVEKAHKIGTFFGLLVEIFEQVIDKLEAF